MASIKSLFKDTAYYGLSSIVGKFLNWLLVPLYTAMFATGEYGEVTYLYSWVAIGIALLTYGMETGFFNFVRKEGGPGAETVYSTTIWSVAASTMLYIVLLVLFLNPITDGLSNIGEQTIHPLYVLMLGITMGIDAFVSIPFAYIRYRKQPLRFATIRLINIAINIGLNLWFILICPWVVEQAPSMSWIYDPTFGIGYIFLANLVASAVTLLLLLPELRWVRPCFDNSLWRKMLSYSWPLLIVGIAGILNQTVANILYPVFAPDKAQAMSQLGIYSANYKLGVIMVMFLQAFRYAFDPFTLVRDDKVSADQRRRQCAQIMLYFVAVLMFIFIAVMFYLDIIRHFINSRYYEGLKVVPVILLAEFFFGVFYNISVWSKITGQTRWNMYYSIIGLAATLGLNALLVPMLGYVGCAWAAFGCYGLMMVVAYFTGQSRYAIPYDMRRLAAIFAGALALWGLGSLIHTANQWADMALRTPLLLLYVFITIRLLTRPSVK